MDKAIIQSLDTAALAWYNRVSKHKFVLSEQGASMKLYNTRLLVKDFKASFLFYRDILGLMPAFGTEDDVYSEFQTDGGALLALFKSDLMSAVIGSEQSLDGRDKTVLVFEVPDVDKTVSELQAKGVTFLTLPEDRSDWGIRTAHLRDPEGNLIEVYSPLPR